MKINKSMELTWLPTSSDVSVEVITENNSTYVELSVYESFDGYSACLNKEQVNELILLLEKAKGYFDE